MEHHYGTHNDAIQPGTSSRGISDVTQESHGPNEKRGREDSAVLENAPPEYRAELARIASNFPKHRPTDSGTIGAGIERKDTQEDIDLNDPVYDPTSDQFDHYKWVRMVLKLLDKEGFPRPPSTGIVFQHLTVSGSGSALQYQHTVDSILLAPFRPQEYLSFAKHSPQRQILRNFDGLLKSGELMIVLGRPGSGCSTFLKSLCGELHGLKLSKDSEIQYNGISMERMHKEFKGEVLYNQEVDKHFPHLTVGETLEFAAAARTPEHRLRGISRHRHAKLVTQVVMTIFGLSHTYNTKVGDDYIRGVSGGERKRVSIAEMALSGAPVGAWDNSTRGLDSASALEFVKALRVSANLVGTSHAVAIYQASQAIYDVFDKAIVLYEGREIYFGPCNEAKEYFINMGWHCPPRQTTGDFLTSVTNPQERQAREGMENRVPRTRDDFENYWKNSSQYARLQKEIAEHLREYPPGGESAQALYRVKRFKQAKHVRPKSPYIISIPMQVKLCTIRAYQRIWNDKPSTLTIVIGRISMALIIGSMYYGTPIATAGFQSKGAALFFAVLMNALISVTEINSLYDQRPIIEKQASYAFVHPFAEAFGGIVSDIPVKFVSAVMFNIIFYFLAGLRYEPSQFFIFFLFTFISTLAMSGIFRTLAAATKTLSQAMALAGVIVLAIVIYTGFVIPVTQMSSIPWFSWIRWINPVFYTFEALVANEFHGRRFECSQFVPAYPSLSGNSFICSVRGAVAGERTVSGDSYIETQYSYTYSHVWRNFGILIGFWIFFTAIYLIASEVNSATSSKAEFLVFRRGHVPPQIRDLDKVGRENEMPGPSTANTSSEAEKDVSVIPEQHDIFTWRDVCFDIPVKGGQRRLLDNVSGWVKPGTLTALMGVSGAGKTTLLDVLAKRVSIGVVTGDMLVNGKPPDNSFQRKTGYVQQQDLHLPTTTVREALRFSAVLRQPKSVPRKEKYRYVEEIIDMLNMKDFAEAIVGTPGEGLNVEQRKLLTIGVELAAKPALLIFLDEPTSGLDSQSSWSICSFLRKLADHGQAVLSTIHQPSAILFQEFDRLLFLQKGGKTVYFGEIGEQSRILLDYFERNGARVCNSSENPAEYMMEIIGAGASGKASQDWSVVWNESPEAKKVQEEINRINHERASASSSDNSATQHGEYAMPFISQLWYVTHRVFQQYWREPGYIWAKIILGAASSLFIGFTFFKPDSSLQGFQDVLFSAFMLTSVFSTLVQQIMPKFVMQRSLYEVRERPSKAYSWAAFLIANAAVEIPWQILTGVIAWASYYFPTYGANQPSHRQGLMLLFVVQFYVFTSTFASLVIAALPDAETGGTIATLLFIMTLTFNGVMQSPQALPGFWIFMYRVSPLTYLIAGITATGLHGRAIQCARAELSIFNPPPGTSCGQYLAPYLQAAPGQLYNPTATQDCQYCQLRSADQYLATSNIYYGQRWRNYGLGFAYIGFNIMGTVMLYYMFRVKHYNPTSLVRGIVSGARFVCRVFKRRSGSTPRGREAENGRLL
ncbi:ATP-binding cassette transporter [Aspergillus clavatus NRRL 1]|uniref:ATP-binding cassette transporter n=1 Tax=Aspergillus clavatus (strain ATCC 1007 / CBS 513.65 / DSM 816 / NCTC 3887 / NRRL 1 / QM 1276 / 107) TaxID=344612 RepID=A1CQ14_ASPCL|nr:ATP-binding cassette transporter [Aspergillus clavatus NRRL 1]EAW07735.1 ATP-binding cassette transporter [Aspergillus clavatus NRRL 1]